MEPLMSHNIHEIIDRLQTARQIRDHYAQEFLTRYRKAQIKWADNKIRILEEREMLLRWIRTVKEDVPKHMRTVDIAYERSEAFIVRAWTRHMAARAARLNADRVSYQAFEKHYRSTHYGASSYLGLSYTISGDTVTVSRVNAIPLAHPTSFKIEPLLPKIWQVGTGVDPKGQPSLFTSQAS